MKIASFYTLLICLLLSSCTRESNLQTYTQQYALRLAKVLNSNAIEMTNISLAPYPTLNRLKQDIPDTNIKLFEFYQLKHCQLNTVIAQRNTSLGRLHLPSTRYIYEKQLITSLQACSAQTTDTKLHQKLNTWQKIKQQQLPAVWADLIQLSSETKYNFSANSGFIKGTSVDQLAKTKLALQYLIDIQVSGSIDSNTLEEYLKYLQNNPLPANLWRSQLFLADNLPKLTLWLSSRTASINCASSNDRKNVEYLGNVFRIFFIDKIHPIGGQIHHYHYQLSAIFETLIAHPRLSMHFKAYIESQHNWGFKQYTSAMQQHLMFWQNLLASCNIKPTQN